MSGRTRTHPRAVKRSLDEQIKMARHLGPSYRSQKSWAMRESKRMAAAKSAKDAMLSEEPPATVDDSVQVGRTPRIEPDPCSIIHHDHLPACSCVPPRAQDESPATLMVLVTPTQPLVPLVAQSDGPSSSSEYSQNLNDSPPDSPPQPAERPSYRRGISIDPELDASVMLEQVNNELQECVDALGEQIKTKEDRIDMLNSNNFQLDQRNAVLEAKIAKQRRQTGTLHTLVAAADADAKDLRRVIESKDKEIRRGQAYLQKVLDTHMKQLAVFERRSAYLESESKKVRAELEQLPEVKAEFSGIPSGGVRFTPRVVHPPLGQIAGVD